MRLVRVRKSRWDVLALSDERGECPLFEDLLALTAATESERTKLLALLAFTAANGPPRNREKSNDLGDGLFEFKTKKLRVPYFYDEDRIILCTHVFKKQGQRTPKEEILRALRMRDSYWRAKEEGDLEVCDE